ncbi:MAG TPA: ARMT1-like domain-containing protein [Tepidisphaeraceae bacterium]
MKPFCKLADPGKYTACKWNLTADGEGREYWIPLFIEHIRTILTLGVEAEVARGGYRASVESRAEKCRQKFEQAFTAYLHDAQPYGIVTILTLDIWRDQILREFGFVDCFVDLKARENAKMLPLLPAVCRELDALDEPQQLRAVIEGVFAGNIFDMGAKATASIFLGAGPDFFAIRGKLPNRPWLIDDLDRLNDAWQRMRYLHAILFIDNAGSDFMLGALPMARWLAKRGTRVTLAANERPTLNDVTIADVRDWWPRIIQAEPSFASLPIDWVSTGTGEPLIDLSEISDELNAAAQDADLLILEGMGRGVETNLDAKFTCDTLNIAMLKDEMVSRRLGGKVFDVVCRFR